MDLVFQKIRHLYLYNFLTIHQNLYLYGTQLSCYLYEQKHQNLLHLLLNVLHDVDKLPENVFGHLK